MTPTPPPAGEAGPSVDDLIGSVQVGQLRFAAMALRKNDFHFYAGQVEAAASTLRGLAELEVLNAALNDKIEGLLERDAAVERRERALTEACAAWINYMDGDGDDSHRREDKLLDDMRAALLAGGTE